jgi:hypothetical protein
VRVVRVVRVVNIAAASIAPAAWRCRLQSSRLVFGHKIRRSTSAGFRFEIDITDCEVDGVADYVRDAAIFLDGPRWREAAIGHGPI